MDTVHGNVCSDLYLGFTASGCSVILLVKWEHYFENQLGGRILRQTLLIAARRRVQRHYSLIVAALKEITLLSCRSIVKNLEPIKLNANKN